MGFEDLFKQFLVTYGAWILLIIFIVFSVMIWIIKKGVQNAILEILNQDSLYDNITDSVSQGVLNALEQYYGVDIENIDSEEIIEEDIDE